MTARPRHGVKIFATIFTILTLLIGGGFLISRGGDTARAAGETTETLAYINFNGAQYIDSGVKLGDGATATDLRVRADFQYDASVANSASMTLFGARTASMVNSFQFIKFGASGLGIDYGSTRAQSNPAFWNTDRHVVVMNNNTATVFAADGTTAQATVTAANATPPTANLSIYLGALNNSNVSTANFVGKIYGFRIWQNGALVRDLVPAAQYVCGAASASYGFYDNVSGDFLTAAGLTGDQVVTPPACLSAPIDLSLTPAKNNIAYGQTATFTLTDDEAQTVALSDGGAGGTFNPATATLSAANNYTASVTYTPPAAGNFTITAMPTSGDALTSSLFVSPYSTTIGFIGDSITVGTTCNSGNPTAVQVATDTLGAGFSGVNLGKSGATTASRLSEYNTAIKPNLSGVDVVQIMLGTNDAKASVGITADIYKNNMQTLINNLKADGVRLVILNYPPALFSTSGGWDAGSPSLLAQFVAKIDELVAENGGFVVLGDTAANTWSSGALCDGVHPTAAGYNTLGQLWAGAIAKVLDAEISPDHAWLANVSTHQLGDDATLTHTVDKYLGEFNGVVTVDGVALPDSDFAATGGTTDIELSAGFLNSLSAGEHSLTVGFNGDVTVAATFAITPAKDNSTEAGDNSGNSDGNRENNGVAPTAPSATELIKVTPPNTGVL